MTADAKLLFVEQLMRSFGETDLQDVTRRMLGLNARATSQAVRAVKEKWLKQSKLAPAESLRTRELISVDDTIRRLLYTDKGKLRSTMVLDMPSLVKLLQLRDRITERLLKNEDQLKPKKRSYLGMDLELPGAEELQGRDDTEGET